MTLELIQLVTDRNNLNDVDTWMFFKWVFKSACAVVIVTHTWDIVMGIFEASQSVVSSAAGVIVGQTNIDISSVVGGLESRLNEMDLGPLSDLQSRNQRMFLITFLILNTADTKRQLDNNFFQTNSIAQKYNCQLVQLDFQQEEGMVSSLPLGLNQVEIQRGLTSSGVAIFVPFTTQELFQNSPEALYCGINALSNNIIMVDRKWLKNPNGLILGTPGSGKSFAAKREIVNVFLATNDDIMICDPEWRIWFPGVTAIWPVWQMREPMTNTMPSGSWRTCPSCPAPSAFSLPRTNKNSSMSCAPL